MCGGSYVILSTHFRCAGTIDQAIPSRFREETCATEVEGMMDKSLLEDTASSKGVVRA